MHGGADQFIRARLCIIVYPDFTEAFDSVPHRRLLVKFKSFGIKGDVLNWVDYFIAERKQRYW